jgi:hypothetical protein
MLRKTLKMVLDRIPATGIGETELSIECGLKLADLRGHLANLVKQNLIESHEDYPDHWRKKQENPPEPEQVLECLPGEPVEIGMNLGASPTVIRSILQNLQESGRAIEKDGQWHPTRSIEVISSEELTYEEQSDLLNLERKIEKGFYEAGKALSEIRERKLYRDKWGNFESYILDRFGFKRNYANKQIAAAEIVDQLAEKLVQGTNCTLSVTPTVTLPTSEGQIRPLTTVPLDARPAIWKEAVEQAAGRVPTENLVRKIVKDFQIKDLCKFPNPYKVGQIVLAKGKKGWWVINEVNDFTCDCKNFIGQIKTFHHFDLKELYLTIDQRKSMLEIQKRLTKIFNVGEQIVSPTDSATIKAMALSIGLNVGGTLTDLQDRLLTTLENEMEEF